MCDKCADKKEVNGYAMELRKLILNSHTVEGLKKIAEGINVALQNNSVGVDINSLKALYVEKLESLMVPAKVTKVESKHVCPECNGTGIWKESKIHNLPCFHCHSTGYVTEYRLIPTITVEAMRSDNNKINDKGIVVAATASAPAVKAAATTTSTKKSSAKKSGASVEVNKKDGSKVTKDFGNSSSAAVTDVLDVNAEKIAG